MQRRDGSLIRRAVTAGLVAGVAAGVWGTLIERHLYVLRHYTVPVLPRGQDPIRVLHISDPHIAPWQLRKQAWIASLASLRPDLIVNTGDNLGHPDGLRALRGAFAGFRGVPGVFVHGSNDLYAPVPKNPLRYLAGPSRAHRDPEELDVKAMDSFFTDDLGWTSLNNTAADVLVGDRTVRAFGISDAHRDLDDLDAANRALAALDGPGRVLTIGLTHAPYRRVLDSFVGSGAEMVFAGHTHGGQVRVPFYGALVANCDIPLRQASGLSDWRDRGVTVPLHVSAGIGHSIYAPVRFSCPPEAALLTLVARN